MKVIGDIDEDAIIVIPNEGISGVSSCNEFTAIQVRNSVIASVESINIANPGIAWGVLLLIQLVSLQQISIYRQVGSNPCTTQVISTGLRLMAVLVSS